MILSRFIPRRISCGTKALSPGRTLQFVCQFHACPSLRVVKPFILADIGEGIKEVQIIQWFVQPEARVEQFDKLCEVQSDKAATEITSRFDGVIKKLHYEAEDMAQVGKPLCDIDIQGNINPEDEALTTPPAEQAGDSTSAQQPQKAPDMVNHEDVYPQPKNVDQSRGKHSNLATPAVRGLLKELSVNIQDVKGTGKDGRVMKDDVHKFAAARDAPRAQDKPQPLTSHSPTAQVSEQTLQQEQPIPLTPIQSQMFKTMTRSLQIPHFLYADEVNFTVLSTLRTRLSTNHPPVTSTSPTPRLSSLPFIIKALSITLHSFPLLNSRVSTPESSPPHLIFRSEHNIGVAMDTPQGLLVPNIKNVAAKSILTIASELAHLQTLAQASKLSAHHLTGGTITVSNIGSIGGTYVSPLLVQSEVAILGVGRARVVPAFDEEGKVVRREVCCFSWSADHRVVDGATLARAAEGVRRLVEEPGAMVVGLR